MVKFYTGLPKLDCSNNSHITCYAELARRRHTPQAAKGREGQRDVMLAASRSRQKE